MSDLAIHDPDNVMIRIIVARPFHGQWECSQIMPMEFAHSCGADMLDGEEWRSNFHKMLDMAQASPLVKP